MAIFTRVYGDAQGVNVMDPGRTAGNVIATGLTKAPICFQVYVPLGDLRTEMVTGGAVETILRNMAVDSTIVMYQVTDQATVGNVNVLVEATGSNASTLQTTLRTLGNIGAAGNVWAGNIEVRNTGFVLKGV